MSNLNLVTADNIGNMFGFNNFLLVTHNGVFHADDVMSTALLITTINRLNQDPTINLKRLNKIDMDVLESMCTEPTACIIYDIGGGDFDHHGEAEYREGLADDGFSLPTIQHPYAAFGKLWRSLGPLMFDHETVYHFDRHIADKVDLCDNGVVTNPLSIFISTMNPQYGESDDDRSREKAFTNAVTFALKLITRWMDVQNIREVAKFEFVSAATAGLSSDGRYCVMNKYIPSDERWIESHPELLFMISPSARTEGAWNLMTISKKKGSFEARKYFPEEWVDKYPAGCTFVHKAKFISEFTSKDAAIAAAKFAVAA